MRAARASAVRTQTRRLWLRGQPGGNDRRARKIQRGVAARAPHVQPVRVETSTRTRVETVGSGPARSIAVDFRHGSSRCVSQTRLACGAAEVARERET